MNPTSTDSMKRHHYNHSYFTTAASIAFVVCSLVSSPDRAFAGAPATTIPSDSNYKAHYAWNKSCEDRVVAMRGKPCDIIFIGDSITGNFVGTPTPAWDLVGGAVWEKHYGTRNALNFGVGADTTQNVLWRMEHMGINTLDPKVAVVLIGTNNHQNTVPEIADGVKAVLKKTAQLFPKAKIILISILPNGRAAQLMADANQIIQTFADGKSIYYFDLASKILPEGNTWKGLGRDRIHLKPEAYELWASAMEPLLTQLLPQNQSTHTPRKTP